MVLDGVFGPTNFRNEIVWKRSNPKSHGSTNFPNCTDTILRYTKTDKFRYQQPFEEHDPVYFESAYKYSDEKGRYRLLPLLNPNDNRPNLTYEFLGVNRVWRWTKRAGTRGESASQSTKLLSAHQKSQGSQLSRKSERDEPDACAA